MILEKKNNFTYLSFSKDDEKSVVFERLNAIKKNPDNLIIDLKSKLINKEDLILSFRKYSSFWKKKNKSFILVVNESLFDLFKDIVCVPTVQEAVDYLYMEELERNV